MSEQESTTGFSLEKSNDEQSKTSALEKLKQKLLSESNLKKLNFIDPKGIKVSALLQQLVAPYSEDIDTVEEYESLLNLGILGWNISFLSKKEQQQFFNQMFTPSLDMEEVYAEKEIQEILKQLVIRKRKLFGSCKRYILDIEVENRGDSFHVAVVSTPL